MATSFGKAFGQQGRLDGELITATDGTVYAIADTDFAVVAGGFERLRIKSDGSITGAITQAPPPSGDATGVTDTAKLQAAINAAAGGTLVLSPGTYNLSNGLTINFPNTTIAGAGKFATKLVRVTNTFGTVITNDNQDGTVLRDFSIDAGLSGFPANANNGIRIFDSSNVLVQRVKITNYQNSAILCFTTTAGTKSNVLYDTCECDGTTGGNNGLLIVGMDESGMRDCRASNINGGSGPNLGLQLKNNCRHSFIENGYANNCVSGFAFGNDTSSEPSVSESRITGGIAVNCGTGFIGGYFDHCEIEGLVIVQQAGNLEAIRIQGSSHDNAVLGTVVHGTPSPKGVVRFDDSAHDNFVELDMVDASAGGLGEFEGTSANNMVAVRRTGVAKPAAEKIGTSTGTGNTVWVQARPQDQIRLVAGENMLAENFQREIGAGASALTQGTGYFMRLPLRAGTVVTNLLFLVTTAAVGMTLSKVGLFKKDGTQLAVSADQGVSWQSVGIKVNPLTAPYTVPTDDVYFVCVLSVGTTGPTVLRGGATGTQNAISSGGIIPYGAQAGLADLPSPATIVTTNGVASWVAVT